jgi:hypothetical protein
LRRFAKAAPRSRRALRWTRTGASRLRWLWRRLGRQPMRSRGERSGLVSTCGLASAFLRLWWNEIHRRRARHRRVGGRRRFGQPGRSCLRVVVRLLRTRPPRLSPQGVVAVGHCKFSLQLSNDANFGRSQVSTTPHHQDTPGLGLPALVHFSDAPHLSGTRVIAARSAHRFKHPRDRMDTGRFAPRPTVF